MSIGTARYDFRCEACDLVFEVARSSAGELLPAQCPACRGWHTKRKYRFSVAGRASPIDPAQPTAGPNVRIGNLFARNIGQAVIAASSGHIKVDRYVGEAIHGHDVITSGGAVVEIDSMTSDKASPSQGDAGS